MSPSLRVKAYSSTENKEFQKHLKAVRFCIENELSFPKETSEFFKGKVDGNNLEDINPKYIIGYIENGVEVPIIKHSTKDSYETEIMIKVSEIPAEVDTIVVSLTI